jgi:hypothetical protein
MSDPAREPTQRASRPRINHKEEAYRLNLFYLLAAKEALCDEGPEYASIVYGLRDPLLSWLGTASATQIERLAQSKQMLFASRLPDGKVGERVLMGAGTDEGSLLGKLHALQMILTDDDDGNL